MAQSRSCGKFKGNSLGFCCTKSVLLVCSIALTFCMVGSVQAAQNDIFMTKTSANCAFDKKHPDCLKSPPVNRSPRQEQKQSESLMALVNWLFGPPANAAVSPQPGYSTVNSSETGNNLESKPEPKNATPIPPAAKQESKGSSKANSHETQRNKKDIEITDVQASVGTELYSSQLHEDPSQINLKDELDLVEQFDQSVKQQPQPQIKTASRGRTGRLKREPYKPIKVPYTTARPTNLANNIFRQRQLLVNPYEQQMVALQQQQQAAAVASAMLQQQQMDALLNGNRYALLDDYDKEDDDESEEDSDELDDFTRFGPPTIEHHHMYLRNALPPPVPIAPYQRKLGWGLRRRSVSDKKKNQENRREEGDRLWGRGPSGLRRGSKRKYRNRASLKSGQWFLDDYDLNSEFHDRLQERRNLPNHSSGNIGEHTELDEEEHYTKYNEKFENKKGENLKQRGGVEYFNQELRDSLPQSRQETTTTEEASTNTETTTMAGAGSTEATGSTGATNSTERETGNTATTEGSTANSNSTTSPGNSTDATTTGEGVTVTDGTDTTDFPTEGTTESSGSTEKPKPKPPYKATLNCRCGTQSVRGEGMGEGTVVRVNVNPWLVSISKGRQHLCSGSIINDRYILTSKSCVQGVAPGSLNVTTGLTSRNATSFYVSKITTNPDVNLALLQLKTTIKPSHLMRPVCLPIGKRYAGQYSTATLVTFKQVPPNIQMLDTEVSIMNKNSSKCKTDNSKICAGPPGSMKCGGDTGGVLMVYRGGYSYEQIGVVANTVGCRSNSTPGMYTDVRKKTRWILNNSRNGNYCKSPPVTDEDLMSTTRVGNPSFVLSEAFEDSDEFEHEDIGNDSGYNAAQEELHNAAEVPGISWEDE